MKILITGGAGFIGSALIRHILSCTSASVVNIDCLTYAGNLDSLGTYSDSEKYSFEQINICNADELKKAFEFHTPDAVIHLAAESHVDRSINRAEDFIKTNILGTYRLLEVARSYWENLDNVAKNVFRFQHISTDEVYGDLSGTDDVFSETSPYQPSSPYSATKASSDHLVRAWARTYDLPVIITNCSNNYGPFQFPEKLIPNTILNAINGKPLQIYGNGNQIRDWLYVEDHVKALYMVLTSGLVGETYNIGGQNQKKNITVVEKICDLLEQLVVNKPKGIKKYCDLITFVTDRPGHDVHYAIDASKIQQELGWKSEETFDSGLKKTVQWYLDNDFWWKNILSGEYRLK